MSGYPEGLRPRITLSWAQGLDGSITGRRGERTRISGEDSLAATHRLRSEHDAILVGVSTVLADDPRLDVRHARGPSPQPVVLDAELRTPIGCALLARSDTKPWIFAAAPSAAAPSATGVAAEVAGAAASAAAPSAAAAAVAGAVAVREGRRAALLDAGCRIFEVGSGADGYLNLAELLATLAGEGVASLMVEGGGAVLASFLESRLVDRIVITIGPRLLGGYNPFAGLGPGVLPVELENPRISILGRDVVLEGLPRWPTGGDLA